MRRETILVAFAASFTGACAVLVTVGDEYSREYCEGVACDGGRGAPTETDGATWVKLTATQQPPDPRHKMMMTWDPLRAFVLMFGGFQGAQPGDSWKWQDDHWTKVNGRMPEQRLQASFAYHPKTQSVVLFGGVSTTPFTDTWTWDGSRWTKVSPSPSPSPPFRYAAPMAATANDDTILFGGVHGTIAYDDTWEWDGQTWTEQTSAPHPPPLSSAAMAYDAERHETVLFGGEAPSLDGGPKLPSDETWIWKSTGGSFGWSKAEPSAKPSPRYSHAMAFDSVRGKIVLFGGTGPPSPGVEQSRLDDTWIWTGTTWEQVMVATKPPARGYPGMSQGWSDGGVILFGGAKLFDASGVGSYFDDTWMLR